MQNINTTLKGVAALRLSREQFYPSISFTKLEVSGTYHSIIKGSIIAKKCSIALSDVVILKNAFIWNIKVNKQHTEYTIAHSRNVKLNDRSIPNLRLSFRQRHKFNILSNCGAALYTEIWFYEPPFTEGF